jgi:hypothetical protein
MKAAEPLSFLGAVSTRRCSGVTEQQKKAAVMALMESERFLELEKRRRKARELSHQNVAGQRHGIPYSVCSDDVNEALGIQKEVAKSRYRDRNNINGAIFRGDQWVFLCRVRSSREGSHAREIKLWTLKPYAMIAADQMLRNGTGLNTTAA